MKCCFGGANEERSRSEGPGNSRFQEMTNEGLGSRISREGQHEKRCGGGGYTSSVKFINQKATEKSNTIAKPQAQPRSTSRKTTSTSMSETRIIQPPNPLTVARTTEDAALPPCR